MANFLICLVTALGILRSILLELRAILQLLVISFAIHFLKVVSLLELCLPIISLHFLIPQVAFILRLPLVFLADLSISLLQSMLSYGLQLLTFRVQLLVKVKLAFHGVCQYNHYCNFVEQLLSMKRVEQLQVEWSC